MALLLEHRARHAPRRPGRRRRSRVDQVRGEAIERGDGGVLGAGVGEPELGQPASERRRERRVTRGSSGLGGVDVRRRPRRTRAAPRAGLATRRGRPGGQRAVRDHRIQRKKTTKPDGDQREHRRDHHHHPEDGRSRLRALDQAMVASGSPLSRERPSPNEEDGAQGTEARSAAQQREPGQGSDEAERRPHHAGHRGVEGELLSPGRRRGRRRGGLAVRALCRGERGAAGAGLAIGANHGAACRAGLHIRHGGIVVTVSSPRSPAVFAVGTRGHRIGPARRHDATPARPTCSPTPRAS